MKIFIFICLIGIVLSGPFPEGEKFRTGFLPIDEESKDKLFYWLFDSRDSPKTDPLVLWLTGGPGCASGLACLVENGPYRMDEGASALRILKEGWNDKANLLFVDQPIGTGFSAGSLVDYCRTEDCVARDFYLFFKKFLQKYPEFKKRPFIITGESYAGHYIPAIAAYIKHKQKVEVLVGFNLVSVAIGNGLTDPYNQYPAYAEFALAKNLVNEKEYNIMKKALKECQELIIAGSSTEALEECNLASQLAEGFYKAKHGHKFNVYDYTKECIGKLCYNFDNVGKFFNDKQVQKELGVNKKWIECDQKVHLFMMYDWMTDLAPKINYLLTNDVHVLIYAGDLDYICNYMGNDEWTKKLEWAYKNEFNAEALQEWPAEDGSLELSKNYGTITYKKGEYGLLRRYKNFSFLQVFNAGHMVPMDKPQAALIMLEEFFHNLLSSNLKKQDN